MAGKALCMREELKQHVLQAVIQVMGPDSTVVYYTDVSVDPKRGMTGAATVVTGETEETVVLVIHTDSKSCSSTVSGRQRAAHHHHHHLQFLAAEGRRVRLNWVPSHVGLRGNVVADEAAHEAPSDMHRPAQPAAGQGASQTCCHLWRRAATPAAGEVRPSQNLPASAPPPTDVQGRQSPSAPPSAGLLHPRGAAERLRATTV